MHSPLRRKVSKRLQDLGSKLYHWAEFSGRPIHPDSIAFQYDIDEIVCQPPPTYMRFTFYMVIVLFVLLIVIASVRHVDVVVVGTGRIVTDQPPIMLQTMERSIIRSLNVKPGDTVTKGQVLATLDPTFAQADLNSLSAQERTILAQVQGLKAILDGKPLVTTGLSSEDEQLQASLYRQRMFQYEARLRSFDEEISRLQTTYKTTGDDRVSLANQLAMAEDVENMRQTLMQHETGSKLQYMDSRSMRMRIERDYQDTTDRLVEIQHGIQAKRADRQAFQEEWRRQFLENLVAARTEATKLGENMTKAMRMNDMVVVTAPADGMVLDVAKRSVGSIMREAETFVTIVPADAPMVVEIAIDSGDVGYTKPGDEAVVKIDAFPYQRHGFLRGRLRSVSEDSLASGDQNGHNILGRNSSGAFHHGWVELEATPKLMNLPEGAHMIPGMTASVDIKVGSRSVISYFMYPVTRAFTESIREP